MISMYVVPGLGGGRVGLTHFAATAILTNDKMLNTKLKLSYTVDSSAAYVKERVGMILSMVQRMRKITEVENKRLCRH